MPPTYYSTKDLRERFRCSSRTLFRRMKRARNPFPAPCIRHAGSFNLWDVKEVLAWEQRERDFARRSAPAGLAMQLLLAMPGYESGGPEQ